MTNLLSNQPKPVRTETGTTYTAVLSDHTIFVDNSAEHTLTLPTAASAEGLVYTIVKVSAAEDGDVIIDGDGSDINGAASVAINTQYGALILTSDGSEWYIMAQ